MLATELEITRVAGPAVKKLARKDSNGVRTEIGLFYVRSKAKLAGGTTEREVVWPALLTWFMVLLCPLRELGYSPGYDLFFSYVISVQLSSKINE